MYHIYSYLREDGSPYYIGKGKDKWRWSARVTHNVPVPPKERVKILYTDLTNEEACAKEVELIAQYGRKDNGTGILRNLTDGGEGATGRVVTEEQKEKQRRKMKGRKPPPKTEEGRKKLSQGMKGNTRALGKRWKRSDYIVYCPELKKEWDSIRICREELGVSRGRFSYYLNSGKKLDGFRFYTKNVG